jgi:hypothetical protein
VQVCWNNAFCNFSEPVGTSLVCIQGPWSNVADAKIKSGLAAQAIDAGSTSYNPLYARASQMPPPWGVTALFAEHTGDHPPIDVNWSLEPPIAPEARTPAPAAEPVLPVVEQAVPRPAVSGSFWDLALAINRSDPAALEIAQNGAGPDVTVDPAELRKLLGTVWFRSVFPRLSNAWRDRLLDVLINGVVIPNHLLKLGRRDILLQNAGLAELKELFSRSSVTETVRSDIRLLMSIANLWGQESLQRLQFADGPSTPEAGSRLALMFKR